MRPFALRSICLPLLFGSCCLARAQSAHQEVVRLRTQYENAVDRVVAPLQDKFLAELKRLRENYTKAGDLDSAIVVDREIKAEIASRPGETKLPDTEEELKAYLLKYDWMRLAKKDWKYTFDAQGKFLCPQEPVYKATYKVTGRRSIVIFWSSPEVGMPCVVSEDCQAIGERQGERTVWTRTPK